eukprot:3352373-Rhodomonas_salina.1
MAVISNRQVKFSSRKTGAVMSTPEDWNSPVWYRLRTRGMKATTTRSATARQRPETVPMWESMRH